MVICFSKETKTKTKVKTDCGKKGEQKAGLIHLKFATFSVPQIHILGF